MSWFTNSNGEEITATSYSTGGGDFELIPKGTKLTAIIEKAHWSFFHNAPQGDDFINVQWRVAAPEKYKNRVIFQKIKVFGFESDNDRRTTSDKAKAMLAAIDAIAGGELRKLGRKPEDEDMARHLVGKMMNITVEVWAFNGKEGNWVSAVSPASAGVAPPPPRQVVAPTAPALTLPDEDIPF